MSESPEAYERLILDAMRGDATLFTRNDEIEALWAIIDPILTAWHEDTTSPIPAVPGRLGRARRRPTLLARRKASGWRAVGRGGCDRGRLVSAGHDARRDRGRAARDCCASATPPTRRWRRRACSTWSWSSTATWKGEIANRLERVGPLPRLAHDPVRGRGGPQRRSTRSPSMTYEEPSRRASG